MKFHIKWKKKRAHFSSAEYRSPPLKFSTQKICLKKNVQLEDAHRNHVYY